MLEPFNHREGKPLEKTVLYTVANQRWPISFQEYSYKQEGDFKILQAIFWNFEGRPIAFEREEVAKMITPSSLRQIQNYISSAKTLVDWLSKYKQSSPK